MCPWPLVDRDDKLLFVLTFEFEVDVWYCRTLLLLPLLFLEEEKVKVAENEEVEEEEKEVEDEKKEVEDKEKIEK